MKVVFTSLGPNREYTSTDGQKFKDGDVTELNKVDYQKAVVDSKFAQDHTPELEIRTKRLVESADKKRKEILAKMSKLKK
jgi:hypothetical protein